MNLSFNEQIQSKLMYKILIKRRAEKFFDELPAKSRKIVEEHIKILIEYAGEGRGDKKKLKLKSKEIYRMHIGRSYTVFYA